MVTERIQTFREFWPFYLGEHRHPVNRMLHYIGTGLVLVTLSVALWYQVYKLLMVIPLLGYGFAWIGHFRVEHNRPATFQYPFWSLAADFKMFFFAITGKMPRELKKFFG